MTDRLQAGFYFSDWRVQHSEGSTSTQWRDVAVELIYNLTDPQKDCIGSALYGEVTS